MGEGDIFQMRLGNEALLTLGERDKNPKVLFWKPGDLSEQYLVLNEYAKNADFKVFANLPEGTCHMQNNG